MTSMLTQATGRRTPAAIGGDIAAGLLLFLVVNWVAARWVATLTALATPAMVLVVGKRNSR